MHSNNLLAFCIFIFFTSGSITISIFFEGSVVTRGSGTEEAGGSRMQLVKCPGIGFTSCDLNVGSHVELTCKDGDLAKPR